MKSPYFSIVFCIFDHQKVFVSKAVKTKNSLDLVCCSDSSQHLTVETGLT